MASLPLTQQRDLVQRIPSFSSNGGRITGGAASTSLGSESRDPTANATTAVTASSAVPPLNSSTPMTSATGAVVASHAAKGSSKKSKRALLHEFKTRKDFILEHDVVKSIEEYIQAAPKGSASSAASMEVPEEVIDVLVSTDNNLINAYKAAARQNANVLKRRRVALELQCIGAHKEAFNQKRDLESTAQEQKAAKKLALEKVSKQQALRRFELLRKEVLRSYKPEIAREQYEDFLNNSKRPAIFSCVESKDWHPVLVELSSRHPDCLLIEYTMNGLVKELANDSDKDGDFSVLEKSRSTAWKPSTYVPLLRQLVVKICNTTSSSSLAGLPSVPTHQVREDRIQLLCHLAHQSEGSFVHTMSLLSRVYAKRRAAEIEAGCASSSDKPHSIVLLRIRYLKQRLRDWAWTQEADLLGNHDEHVALSRAMYLLSVQQDPLFASIPKDHILAVDQLRAKFLSALTARRSQRAAIRSSNGKGNRSHGSQIESTITTIEFAKSLERLASSGSGVLFLEDTLALDALLTDVVYPLAAINVEHRRPLVRCISRSVVKHSQESTENYKKAMNQVSVGLERIAEFCNNKIPSKDTIDAIAKLLEKDKFCNTRIFARAIMIWISESLQAKRILDEPNYEVISLRLLEILRVVSVKHYTLRPEIFSILKNCLGVEPTCVNDAAKLRIKRCIIHCIADLIWHTHPAKAPGAHDGVEFDALKLMSDIASRKPGTPVQLNSSISHEDIVFEFIHVLFQTIRPVYSPAFSCALGMFLSAVGENKIIIKRIRRSKVQDDVQQGIREFSNSGYRKFMREEDHLPFQRLLDQLN